MILKKNILFLLFVLIIGSIAAQERTNQNMFRQLTEELPTPNGYRTATGRPGPDYFQQQVDYKINVSLDEDAKTISGEETITYHNNSPEKLNYLWLQLDQNVREENSFGDKISSQKMAETMPMKSLQKLNNDFDGGFKIESVKDAGGNDLQTVKNYTILKVILSEPLPAGKETRIKIKWHYNLNNIAEMWGRSGYNEEANGSGEVFAIAQFYPRLCVFNDMGWQIKQFVDAEFALEFGNFDVDITVPADHIVAATGELKNATEVLAKTQQKRLQEAQKSESPVSIITEDEAVQNEKSKSEKTKTWHFVAQNVRDFAFASSRKFLWDAMAVHFPKNDVMAMSFYPKEANPLWEKYTTIAIGHTLKVYSAHTFDYPYPSAIAVNFQGLAGMEYPMICFNNGQPNADKTYSAGQKREVIGAAIHEVGHNFFPMMINSDERQWAWMDEGFDIFLQGMAEREWDSTWGWSGRPAEMKGYMDDDPQTIVPIMTDADALLQGGMNSYRKPSAGLNILRETILGRELFDQAFKEYANTWKFKHPQPADFFRIMEDASGMDLDWFWRGWFFTTEYVDLAIDNVVVYEPVFTLEQEEKVAQQQKEETPVHIAKIRERNSVVPEVEKNPSLKDKYNEKQPLLSGKEIKSIEELNKTLSDEDLALLENGMKYYEVTFTSPGGMPMPLIVQFEFTDGTKDIQRIPAEVWLKNQKTVTKVFPYKKDIKSIVLDPFVETADINTQNNYWPRKTEHVYFRVKK